MRMPWLTVLDASDDLAHLDGGQEASGLHGASAAEGAAGGMRAVGDVCSVLAASSDRGRCRGSSAGYDARRRRFCLADEPARVPR
jgi:hypothetical protein